MAPGAAVGVTVGGFAVAAAILRPVSGRLGDRRGRRLLLVGGLLTFALWVLCYGLIDALPWLVAMRVLSGVGEAAVFVGAATMAQDLAPPHRRGEAASYFSVAIYGGLGIGPPLGEAVRRTWGTSDVWFVAAGFGLLAAALGLAVPRSVGGPHAPPPGGSGAVDEDAPAVSRASAWKRRVFHPAAVGPGVILMLATAGLAAFIAFMPLYAHDPRPAGLGRGVPAVLRARARRPHRRRPPARPARRDEGRLGRPSATSRRLRVDGGVGDGDGAVCGDRHLRPRRVAHVPLAAPVGDRRRARGRAQPGRRHVHVVLRRGPGRGRAPVRARRELRRQPLGVRAGRRAVPHRVRRAAARAGEPAAPTGDAGRRRPASGSGRELASPTELLGRRRARATSRAARRVPRSEARLRWPGPGSAARPAQRPRASRQAGSGPHHD